MDKVYQKIEEAIAELNDGAVLPSAGSSLAGCPGFCYKALIDKKKPKI